MNWQISHIIILFLRTRRNRELFGKITVKSIGINITTVPSTCFPEPSHSPIRKSWQLQNDSSPKTQPQEEFLLQVSHHMQQLPLLETREATTDHITFLIHRMRKRGKWSYKEKKEKASANYGSLQWQHWDKEFTQHHLLEKAQELSWVCQAGIAHSEHFL